MEVYCVGFKGLLINFNIQAADSINNFKQSELLRKLENVIKPYSTKFRLDVQDADYPPELEVLFCINGNFDLNQQKFPILFNYEFNRHQRGPKECVWISGENGLEESYDHWQPSMNIYGTINKQGILRIYIEVYTLYDLDWLYSGHRDSADENTRIKIYEEMKSFQDDIIHNFPIICSIMEKANSITDIPDNRYRLIINRKYKGTFKDIFLYEYAANWKDKVGIDVDEFGRKLYEINYDKIVEHLKQTGISTLEQDDLIIIEFGKTFDSGHRDGDLRYNIGNNIDMFI